MNKLEVAMMVLSKTSLCNLGFDPVLTVEVQLQYVVYDVVKLEEGEGYQFVMRSRGLMLSVMYAKSCHRVWSPFLRTSSVGVAKMVE